ncbi:MAG TPA: hypothetical protein VF804_06710 [Holophagaceae bacterium]
MPESPEPEALRQTIVDEEHLRMLTLGYYLSAGMCLLFSLFGGMYMVLGLMFTFAFRNLPAQPPNTAPPPEMGWVFFAMGAFLFGAMVTLAILKFLTARRLKARASRTFCLVIAGISCLEVPYGTTLGVLTFVVLSRDSVKALFSPAPAD